MRVWLLPLVWLPFLIAGCSDYFVPETGDPTKAACNNDDTDPDVEVSFDTDILSNIIMRPTGGCIPCHDPSAGLALGVDVSGLALTSYSSLVKGGSISGAGIVRSGQPCESGLYLKVSAGPPFGSRMPLNGPPFLDDDKLQLIHDWIAEGARDN